jgi:hypothetical protein
MAMEGHGAAFGRCTVMPYQDIAAGSLRSSQQHPAYYRSVTLRSVRAVARAVSEARICLTRC